MTRASQSLTCALLIAWASSACSGGVSAVPLQPSRPGAVQYRVECIKDVSRCREKASEVCGGEYEVLQSSGRPVEPERITTAPGPVSTGPNFSRPGWAGELIVECGRRAPAPRPEAAPAVSTAAVAPAVVPAAVPSGDQVCVPGVTQLCLGPAACRGAQACLASGRGFGPCDCGTAASTSASEPAPMSSDAGVATPRSE
jgi:hypothetical protein